MSSSRVALVTGAAQGIGKAISLRLAADGLDIALNDLPSKASQLQEVKELVEKAGRKATIAPGDVTNEDEVATMIAKCVEDLGSLDVFVANAGIVLWKPFLDSKQPRVSYCAPPSFLT
jgi:NAD(P)-dependent dehydrogenase (short-subunit alcohol dehydrogenase family)